MVNVREDLRSSNSNGKLEIDAIRFQVGEALADILACVSSQGFMQKGKVIGEV